MKRLFHYYLKRNIRGAVISVPSLSKSILVGNHAELFSTPQSLFDIINAKGYHIDEQ